MSLQIAHSWFRATVVATCAAAALALTLNSGSAKSLHLALSRSQPMADSTIVVAPAAIQLWFNQLVKAPVTAIRLIGSDSTPVALEPLTVGATAREPVSAKIKAPLKPGRYKVLWRTSGDDSHVVSGEFFFTFRAAGIGDADTQQSLESAAQRADRPECTRQPVR